MQREKKISENTYGIKELTTHTLQAFSFEHFTDFATNDYFSAYCPHSGCFFEAPLMIPSGASVVAIELEACDDDEVNDIDFTLFEMNSLESGITTVASETTSGTPGCNFFWGRSY